MAGAWSILPLLAATASTSPVQPGPIETGLAPFAIQYAACAYSADTVTRTTCPALKAQLIEQTAAYVAIVYPRIAIPAKQRFARFLAQNDAEADYLNAKNNPLPPLLQQYLSCLSSAIVDERSKHASVLSFNGYHAADACKGQLAEIRNHKQYREVVMAVDLDHLTRDVSNVKTDTDYNLPPDDRCCWGGFFAAWRDQTVFSSAKAQ